MPVNVVPDTLRRDSPIAERESGGRAVRKQNKYIEKLNKGVVRRSSQKR